jgi:hypothetical protein
MSKFGNKKKNTIQTFIKKKAKGEKIVVLTAFSFGR